MCAERGPDALDQLGHVHIESAAVDLIMRILGGMCCAALIAASIGDRTVDAAASCESLASMALSNATITLATVVEAGAVTPPTSPGGAPPPTTGPAVRNPPALFLVAAPPTPSSAPIIKIENCFPISRWN